MRPRSGSAPASSAPWRWRGRLWLVEEGLKHSFEPVVRGDTRLILLGSLPGEESLARRQYYANPRNQFWRLVGEVIDRNLADLEYTQRLEALLDAGIGLWDVVRSARRTGSLDGAIREHRPNALPELARSLPQLRAIGFNGGTSARIGMRALGGLPLALVALPSSSPAFTRPFEAKLAEWRTLKRFLDDGGNG